MTESIEKIKQTKRELNNLKRDIPFLEKALEKTILRIKNPKPMDYLPSICSIRSIQSNNLRIQKKRKLKLEAELKKFYSFANCKFFPYIGKRRLSSLLLS